MEVIYRLIPAMVLIGLIMVGVLYWAVRRGQYEDFEGDSQRILLDDDEDKLKAGEQPSKGVTKPADNTHWPDAD
jgi:cbb3-type cytochrome oxidase maturation protein